MSERENFLVPIILNCYIVGDILWTFLQLVIN